MLKKRDVRASALAVVGVVLGACGGGDGGGSGPAPAAPSAPTQPVEIRFAAVAGGSNTPVACGTVLRGIGSTPVDAQLTDLRFYVTDVQLVDDLGTAVPLALDANEWQHTGAQGSVALIDLENAQGACGNEGTFGTNAVLKGRVPAGTFVKVRATLGVPEVLNHSDILAAPPPLDIAAMGWSWQAGRKFIKIELNPAGGVATPVTGGTSVVSTYSLHLASTDCTGPNDGTDTCAKKNLARLELDIDPATQQVAVDVAELFSASDVRNNQNDAVGCMSAMSDLDCPALFGKFGLDMVLGGPAAAPQTVFRVIPR